jgi:hypothetical protein
MPSERRPSSIVPQVLVTIGSGHDDLWSNPYPPKRELLTRHSRHCFDKTPVQAFRSVTRHAKPRKRASGGPAIA